MINKILMDETDVERYDNLPQDKKDKYTKLWQKFAYCPERYYIALDIPSSKDSSELCCLIAYRKENNKIEITNIEYF